MSSFHLRDVPSLYTVKLGDMQILFIQGIMIAQILAAKTDDELANVIYLLYLISKTLKCLIYTLGYKQKEMEERKRLSISTWHKTMSCCFVQKHNTIFSIQTCSVIYCYMQVIWYINNNYPTNLRFKNLSCCKIIDTVCEAHF